MERRYYALKGIALGAALIVAAWCGTQCPHFSIAGDPHYQAVVVAQGAIHDTGVKLAHQISRLFASGQASL